MLSTAPPVKPGGRPSKRSKNGPTCVGAPTASKRSRHEKGNNGGVALFTSKTLHEKADAHLLAFLFECHRVLRDADTPFTVGTDFVHELVGPRYLKSSIPDVQQMTGCVLSDIVRLSETDSGEAALPFDAQHANDVLACLTAPFADVASGERALKTCGHIIERASASHIFLRVIPHCQHPMTDQLTLPFASIHYSTVQNPTGDEKTTTAVNSVEMASILLDILQATGTITPEQLSHLLREVTAASPALRRRTEANRRFSDASNGKKGETNKIRQGSQTFGAVVAARVLLNQVSVIQPAITSYVQELVQRGAGLVSTGERSGGNVEMKREGLRDIGRAMETLVALVELHVDLVSQIMPLLETYLQHEHPDVRLVLMRGFAVALVAHENAASAYKSAFTALLERFNDPKPTLRIEMIQLAATILRSEATQKQINRPIPGHVHLFEEITPYLKLSLIDPQVHVRRAAVSTYGELANELPSIFPSEQLQKSLGMRVGDKNLKVRQVAVEQLCSIYCKHLYAWIPDTVMQCLNGEGGVSLLESQFEKMLPSLSEAVTTERRRPNSTTTPQSQGIVRSLRKSVPPLFDFETADVSSERTYASALAELCGHLSPAGFALLLTFARKKPQLRLTILRLFQMRAEVRSKDPRSAEGQEVINNIHRLLKFLQGITHAERGEWDALFRAKDDKISKAFMSCCAEGVLRYATEREVFLTTLKGRLEGPVLKFVQDFLSRQMMLALDVEHVEELLSRLETTIQRVSVSAVRGSVGNDLERTVSGLLRALLLCGCTAPPFLHVCATPLVTLLKKLCTTSDWNVPLSWVFLLLQFISAWLSHESGAGERHGDKTSAFPQGKSLLETLNALCICIPEVLFRGAAPLLTGKVCKQAARGLSLLSMAGGQNWGSTLEELVTVLRRHLKSAASEAVTPKAVGWLNALTALAKNPRSAKLLQEESLAADISNLLLVAIRDDTDTEDAIRVKVKSTGPLPLSLSSAVVDAAAKCITAIALSHSPNHGMEPVDRALCILMGAYKAIGERDAYTTGACRRRLSINQQLLKLVVRPSLDIGKELAVAVILSAESETSVRRVVQQKITHHILTSQCDMRYVALLVLTALAEETKSDYQRLRGQLRRVGDHLRAKQVSSGVTLSSYAALSCFLEYSIPFLILFMAHHTFYDSERENHFIAYQRVWHLLFEELFHYGTQCAAFVMELLSRSKQADDALDRGSNVTRVICDLGIRVMQECMGQRQIAVDALKRYPGTVLLPSFFVQNASEAEVVGRVYLDPGVHIAAHVPFRAPAHATAASGSREGVCDSELNVDDEEECQAEGTHLSGWRGSDSRGLSMTP
ncbi:hypothetical protein ERJ75_000189000 [Trypanosoma vivax]|nr:hypothetical protein ERJ75_000189000 [Trypanosoma vivax]